MGEAELLLLPFTFGSPGFWGSEQGGMEDQIGALGLVLNALVPFNTRYMDAAVTQLRADGFEVRNEDVARLSPFVQTITSTCSAGTPSSSPNLPGGLRPLRNPDSADGE